MLMRYQAALRSDRAALARARSYRRRRHGATRLQPGATAGLKYRDGLDLDQELGLRQGRHRDEGVRRHLAAEEFLADRAVVGAVADVGQVGVDLDDRRHRAAAG